MKIYKYELPVDRGVYPITMHRIQYTMHVEVIDDIPFLWAAVDEEGPFTHIIWVLYTGDDVPDTDHLLRIGTAVLHNGAHVLHYFREEVWG